MKSQPPVTDLAPVIEALEEMQAEGIIGKYAIGGAFAAILHAEPIATLDLDIFFLFKEKQPGPILSLERLYEFAKNRGFSFDHEFIDIGGWLVQFVESGNNALWLEAVENAETMPIAGKATWVIAREYLVAMWLFAGREKDYQKISLFISSNIIDEKKLTDLLNKHELSAKWEAEKWRFRDEI
jgi:hypothetical protein